MALRMNAQHVRAICMLVFNGNNRSLAAGFLDSSIDFLSTFQCIIQGNHPLNCFTSFSESPHCPPVHVKSGVGIALLFGATKHIGPLYAPHHETVLFLIGCV